METPQSPTDTATSSAPVVVHLEHLRNVGENDAREYALGLLERRTVSKKCFYSVFAFASGFIVEVHEGGEGKAFTPKVLEAWRAYEETDESAPLRLKIVTGRYDVFVSMTEQGLSTLLMPKGEEITTDAVVEVSDTALELVDFDHAKRFLHASKSLFAVSLVVLMLAAFFRPSSPDIYLVQVKSDTLPLVGWLQHAKWPADERPVTVRMSGKDGRLEVTTTSVHAGLSLKTAAPPVSALAGVPVEPVIATSAPVDVAPFKEVEEAAPAASAVMPRAPASDPDSNTLPSGAI